MQLKATVRTWFFKMCTVLCALMMTVKIKIKLSYIHDNKLKVIINILLILELFLYRLNIFY